MWKNCLLQWRHKTQTIGQIVIPIIFTANLIILRGIAEPEINPEITTFNPFGLDRIPLR